MEAVAERRAESAEYAFLDELIAKTQGQPGALLTVLERAQEKNPHNYLPPDTLRYIARRMQVPLSRIYSVATFYALFNLEAQGRNTVCICRGTACHTRGSRNLLNSLRMELGVGINDSSDASDADKIAITTPDRKFTVRTVACFGQCALAPVIEINHRICSHANERTLQRELRALARESD